MSETEQNDGRSGHGRFGTLALVAAVVVSLAAGAGIASLWSGDSSSVTAPAEEDHVAELPAGVVEVSEAAQKNGGVELITAERRELPATIEVTGVVTPVESRVAHIRPLARGVIEDVAVTLGARVERGQTLITYDNIELGQTVGEYLAQRAALRQAETDYEVRRQAVARAEALIEIEAIAQQTVELRRAELRNGESTVASQRAGVAKVEEQLHRFGMSDADLQRLQEGSAVHRTASHSALRAPFAGVVTKFDIAMGEQVEPDRDLATITDISTVWVLAEVYEKDFAKVQVNTDVRIRVDAYPDRIFIGRLAYVSDIIDPQTRTAKVRCVVLNTDGALKLDMFAKVSVPTMERREVLLVPTVAVQQVEGTSVVFVRQTPLRFERRAVQLGTSAGEVVEVLQGLKSGEEIVASGSFYLKTALLRESIGDEH